jgi:hypothetical protein
LLVIFLAIKLVVLVFLSRLGDLANELDLSVQESFVDGFGLANYCEELVVAQGRAVLALFLQQHLSLSIGEGLSDLTVCVSRWHTAHVNLLSRYLAIRWVHDKEVVFVVVSRLRKEVILDLMVLHNLSQHRHFANDLFKSLALCD